MPFCACGVSNAIIVRFVCRRHWSSMCANFSTTRGAIRWKSTRSDSFQLSKKRMWETSCGKAKFSRRRVHEWLCCFSYVCEGVERAEDVCKKCRRRAFATRGFHNWKLANAVFRQHKLSAFHKEALEWVITLPVATTYSCVAINCWEFFWHDK